MQGFLLVHRADPVAAVSEAKEWADKTLAIKAKGANVATFEGAALANAEPAATTAGADKKVRQAGRNDSAHEDEGEEDDSSENSTLSMGAPPDAARLLAGMSYPAMSWTPSSAGMATGSYRPAYGGSQPTTYASHIPPSRFDVGFSTLMRNGSPAHQSWSSAPHVGPFGSGVSGQPTPPYSRSASRSPPTTDDASEKAGDEGGEKNDGPGVEGEKKDGE